MLNCLRGIILFLMVDSKFCVYAILPFSGFLFDFVKLVFARMCCCNVL